MSEGKALIARRESLFHWLQAINDAVIKCTVKEIDVANVKKSRVAPLMADYNQLVIDIINYNSELKDKNGIEYEEISKAFYDLVDNIELHCTRLSKRAQDKSIVAAVSCSETPRLKPIVIPTFSGDLRNWSEFKGLFDSLVHNSNLPKIQKFQHLRSFLSESAIKIISHLDLSDANYDIAYDILVKRYESPRLHCNYHLNLLLGYKPISLNNHESLQHYYNTHFGSIEAYKALELTDHLDYVLFQACYLHLDADTKCDFDKLFPADVFPTYKDLMTYIGNKLKNEELHSFNFNVRNNVVNKKRTSLHVESKIVKGKCLLCSEVHSLMSCKRFISLLISERYNFLRKNSLCFNCFGAHPRAKCKSSYSCKICAGRHHTLLHKEPDVTNVTSPVTSAPDVFPTPATNVVDAIAGTSKSSMSCRAVPESNVHSVLLGTARGFIRDNCGIYQSVRILLDSGSEVSCISQLCQQKLGLVPQRTNVCLSGINNTLAADPLGQVNVTLSAFSNGHKSICSNALILSKISAKIPSVPVDPSVALRFRGLKLADPMFYDPQEIDFLLGADLYPYVITNKPIIQGKPCGMSTIFGLILVGETVAQSDPVVFQSMLTVNSSLESALVKFWQIEEVTLPKPEDPSNVYCETLFTETTRRTSDGRYVVRLPFVQPPIVPGTNRQEAERRFFSLERRLLRDVDLKISYSSFLQEYLDLGHMELAKSQSNYIIPHHPVFKSSSTTTKTRVVFDGSAKDSLNVSLNDRLLAGPKLTSDISHVICGFRLYAVPLTADIKMMYRQVLVDLADCVHQHIFWRPSFDQPLQEFELKTITYGLAPSAFLSQRVLKQLVLDEGHDFPLASFALQHQVYVDDICGGAASEAEAVALYKEIIELLARGGFLPRKWSSSSSNVLCQIPEDLRESPLHLQSDQSEVVNVLGLHWIPKTDNFSYTVLKFEGDVTKRTVLSFVAKIFDPLGWLTPCVFWVKCFLQQIWLCGADWDDPLPPSLLKTWSLFISDFDELRNVKIQRYVPILTSCTHYVIGFCDASSKGYGAVLYSLTYVNGSPHVSLLQGKSKVAPLKTMSIPRLELNGCLLLTRMLKALKPFLNRLPHHLVKLYCDSSVALSWIRSPPHTLKTYIANRVVEITENCPPELWRHVPTHMNPSDCASRGLDAKALLLCEIWWNGPEFLLQPSSEWPNELCGSLHDPIPETVNTFHTVKDECNDLCHVMSRVSSFNRLIRVYAYVLRFTHNCKLPDRKLLGVLTSDELTAAEELSVRLSQIQFFSKEISKIKEGAGHLTSLRALAPFLDPLGILRVGGRLAQSDLCDRSKHPFFVSAKSPLAKLICKDYHHRMLHAGPQSMRAQIQLKFWIPGIGSLLRSIVFKCTQCYRFKANTVQPPMADLPASRFSQVRAFLNCGVDYAGPFLLRESRRRKSPTYKCWVCVFICFSTKALHLELVTELTTNAFLAAFDRFVSRRGLCVRLQSDCGTNFVGAARALKEIYTFLSNSSNIIGENLNNRKVNWVFNPPASPHFNGITEAAVKSMKFHLTRVVGNHILTYEEFTTFLYRVEAVCNSRPLWPVSVDPNDEMSYLSPAHFLIGASLLAVPELPLTDVNINRLSRWQLIQQTLQCFWKKWSSSYLQLLMPRHKWRDPCPVLVVGDTVLLKNMSLPPLSWPLGRLVALFEGKDGIARVAHIMVGGTLLTRPVTSLVRFPAEQ